MARLERARHFPEDTTMDRTEKEQVVAELTERLRGAESLIVADYRGLTNAQIAELRGDLLEHGARFVVVKNTLTRRAADAAGADALLALLEGPTAIAFVEAEGDPAGVAKALAKSAKDTKVLALRGGVLSGQPMSGEDIERLATLPSLDVLQAQLVGVIVAPLTQLAALLNAPLQDLVGLIDARIEQLGGPEAGEEAPDPSASADDEPAASSDAVAAEVISADPAEDAEPAIAAGAGVNEGDSQHNDDDVEAAAADATDEEE
jgi:large subunit ribosomal protein L10